GSPHNISLDESAIFVNRQTVAIDSRPYPTAAVLRSELRRSHEGRNRCVVQCLWGDVGVALHQLYENAACRPWVDENLTKPGGRHARRPERLESAPFQ